MNNLNGCVRFRYYFRRLMPSFIHFPQIIVDREEYSNCYVTSDLISELENAFFATIEIWIVRDRFRMYLLRITSWGYLKFANSVRKFGHRIIVIINEPDTLLLGEVNSVLREQ